MALWLPAVSLYVHPAVKVISHQIARCVQSATDEAELKQV